MSVLLIPYRANLVAECLNYQFSITCETFSQTKVFKHQISYHNMYCNNFQIFQVQSQNTVDLSSQRHEIFKAPSYMYSEVKCRSLKTQSGLYPFFFVDLVLGHLCPPDYFMRSIFVCRCLLLIWCHLFTS